MASEHKRISIEEFCRLGFLQEANRRFFHPHGLALEITCDDEDYANARLTGVWDYRDDPEGILFDAVDPEKVAQVAAQRAFHWETRRRLFYGPVFFDCQPIECHHANVQPTDWKS